MDLAVSRELYDFVTSPIPYQIMGSAGGDIQIYKCPVDIFHIHLANARQVI